MEKIRKMHSLDGTWRVRMISGPWKLKWFMNYIKNDKVISGRTGYNIAKGIEWGHFDITGKLVEYRLIYRDAPIIDIIRFIDDNNIEGHIYWENKFKGLFGMKRK